MKDRRVQQQKTSLESRAEGGRRKERLTVRTKGKIRQSKRGDGEEAHSENKGNDHSGYERPKSPTTEDILRVKSRRGTTERKAHCKDKGKDNTEQKGRRDLTVRTKGTT